MHTKAAAAIPGIVPKDSWELEFTLKHAIPGSTRVQPSKALLLYSELLGLRSPMRVLDAGCGNGRNTVYLAKRGCDVTSVDFSEFALNETQRRIAGAGVSGKVHLLSIVFSREDEYYSRLLKDSPDGSLVCDPENGIWKRLYEEHEIRNLFSSYLELRYFAKFEFSDVVLGKAYKRVLLTSVLRKQFS